MNNFQQLESEKLNEFDRSKTKIKRNVDKSMEVYRFLGNIFDLYLPKVVGYVNVILGGGSSSQRKSKYPNK